MKLQRFLRFASGITVVAFAAAAVEAVAPAAEATIERVIEARFPGQNVLRVAPAAIDGLYEVFTGTDILYSDASGEHVITGALIETRTRQDLTAKRLDELNSIDFRSLPFDRAIKVVRGNGSRQLAVFSDPDCPYCKALEKELASLTDVTIYTFLFPLPIHPDADEKSRKIWCAPDRARAWLQWMLEDGLPEGPDCEDSPAGELIELGKKLHITGTPTLYFSTGERVTGGLRSRDLAARLGQPSS